MHSHVALRSSLRTVLVLTICAALLPATEILSLVRTTAQGQVPARAGGLTTPETTALSKKPCPAKADLSKHVLLLSGTYAEAQVAGQRLRKLSSRSSTCRARVIAVLMRAMDSPNLDISRDQRSNDLWRAGAVLLGDLKAAEALDLLLSHITMTDGEWSISMIHQPALEGIIRMGAIAVPKLSRLLENRDAKVRHASVYCIAWIGGDIARHSLQQAVSTENDPCVKRFMLVSIDTINVKSGGLKPDHGEWINAFLCKT